MTAYGLLGFSSLVFGLVACGGATASDVFNGGGDGGADATVDSGGPPPPSLTSCTGPGECAVVPRTCCGACGVPSPSDMVGVLATKVGDYRARVCSGGVACPACAGIPEPSLQAFCIGGQCTAVDVRTSDLSACNRDDDCKLRYASCCETCTGVPEGLIAVKDVSGYRDAVCSPNTSCPKCLVRYPPDLIARCDVATKHCKVAKLGQ